MMSSAHGDPRVPPAILPHPNHQTATTPSGSGAGHAHGHGHGGSAGGSGASGDGGQQQQPAQKPRAPKAYTEAQMAFLKSHLEEFEKRSAGPVRGDAKKYALEQASGFVVRFGLPPEFQPLEEGETRFKEQIYNWFKNTIGRKRRQAEGKPRSVKSANSAGNSSKAKADRSVASSSTMPSTTGQSNGGSNTLSPNLQWNSIPQQQAQSQLSSSNAQANSLAAFAGHNHNPGSHVAESSSSSPALGTIQQPQAISLGQMHFGLHTPQQTPQHVHSHTPPVPQSATSHSTHHPQHQQHQHQHQHSTHSSHSSHHSPHEQQHPNSIHPLPAPTPIRVGQGQQQPPQPQQSLSQHTQVNQETLRDAFLSPSVEIPTLASMIQIFVSSCPPSLTPLTPVVEILFGASISSGPSSSYAHGGSSRTIDDLSPLYPNGGSSSKSTDAGGYGNISLKGPSAPHPLAHHSYGSSTHRGDAGGHSRDPTPLVQRFCDASRYWGASIVHCNLTGVEAAGRALMGLVRKWSVWQQPSSISPPASGPTNGGFNPTNNTASSSLGMVGLGLQGGGSSLHGGLGLSGYGSKLASPGPGHVGVGSSSGSSLTEEMQRITAERQRRKDHIQWARIHAGALEVGLVGAHSSVQLPSGGATGSDSTQNYGRYIAERAFSEMVARDAVWEEDEAEWVAGLYVLRGLIRSAVRGNKPFGAGVERRQREEYREMLRVYEGRWKEIKDEVRQSLATEVLFSAKEELDGITS